MSNLILYACFALVNLVVVNKFIGRYCQHYTDAAQAVMWLVLSSVMFVAEVFIYSFGNDILITPLSRGVFWALGLFCIFISLLPLMSDSLRSSAASVTAQCLINLLIVVAALIFMGGVFSVLMYVDGIKGA